MMPIRRLETAAKTAIQKKAANASMQKGLFATVSLKSAKVNDNDTNTTEVITKEYPGEIEMKQKAKSSFDPLTSRSLLLRRSGHAFCPVCQKQIELISFGDAAKLFNTDLQDIEFLATSGDLHQVHNRKGKVMVCTASLFECFEARQTRLLDTGYFEELAAKKSA